MRVDKTKMGLTFSSKRASRDAQEALIRADGGQDIKAVGNAGCETWREAVRVVRPGDEVRVMALVLVPTERGDDNLPPSGQPAEFILEVHQRGGSVIECRTGRNSRDAADRRAMIGDAVRSLRSGGRKLPKSGKPAGRPVVAWTDAQMAQAKRAWFSKDYATNEVAERHMPSVEIDGETVPFTTTRARRLWGPSGRPWPTKRKAR